MLSNSPAPMGKKGQRKTDSDDEPTPVSEQRLDNIIEVLQCLLLLENFRTQKEMQPWHSCCMWKVHPLVP